MAEPGSKSKINITNYCATYGILISNIPLSNVTSTLQHTSSIFLFQWFFELIESTNFHWPQHFWITSTLMFSERDTWGRLEYVELRCVWDIQMEMFGRQWGLEDMYMAETWIVIGMGVLMTVESMREDIVTLKGV